MIGREKGIEVRRDGDVRGLHMGGFNYILLETRAMLGTSAVITYNAIRYVIIKMRIREECLYSRVM